ncbi:MAG: SDR family oxidoreductase [Candidatus Dormibacteraeota bacterium]|nr:SDR family oxidoreductase [Candidatus Dormibacteraeota bacterium]
MRRVVVTGGAGFLGSHLVESFLASGAHVECVDNLITGHPDNIAHLQRREGFRFIEADAADSLHVEGSVDGVLHLASPAAPLDYLQHPIVTLDVGTRGTRNALELAREKRARFLLASTSEVYGDPLEHPQREDYWGNVNPIGPRSVYDEAKRAAEAYAMAYHRSLGVDTRIARIFNTYGPRMRDDGRAVPRFIKQALADEPVTVYGDGSQTRSFCYVDDLIEGVQRLLDADVEGPVNLGNPHEVTLLELAERVIALCGSRSQIVFEPLPEDDPRRRCPDISHARAVLDWEPTINWDDGLRRTIDWWRGR